MTDATAVDAGRAERLARLRERRGAVGGASTAPAPCSPPARTVDPTDTVEIPVVASDTVEIPVVAPPTAGTRAGSRRRRRSPAKNAKIITAGASATAMFGLIAGYGIADGVTSEAETTNVSDGTTAGATVGSAASIPPASPTGTPASPPAATPAVTTPAPQVIVVVVDGTTGRTLSATPGTGDLATDLAAVGIVETTDTASDPAPPTGPAPAAPAPAAPPAPAPVAAPATVDLAVPAPPPPPPAPAAAAPAAAVPAPPPQAVSDGS